MAKERKKKKARKSELSESVGAPLDSASQLVDDPLPGEVSEEAEDSAAEKKESKFDFGIWDLAALYSFVFITIATVLLFNELRQFGDRPWSVSAVEIVDSTPPQ